MVQTGLRSKGTELMEKREKAVVLFSGGMDSTTLLYWVRDRGFNTYAFSVRYGQKHVKEVAFAQRSCQNLNTHYTVFDMPLFGGIAPSALTSGVQKVPEGHYAEESMKQTVVPNRNMVLLSIAASYAIGIKAKFLFYGAHSGDHTIYPDCRPEFIGAMQKVFCLCDFEKLDFQVPFMLMDKTMILREGIKLGVNYRDTWTCYQGKEKPCLKCGSCVERAEAFSRNGIKDPLLF